MYHITVNTIEYEYTSQQNSEIGHLFLLWAILRPELKSRIKNKISFWKIWSSKEVKETQKPWNSKYANLENQINTLYIFLDVENSKPCYQNRSVWFLHQIAAKY